MCRYNPITAPPNPTQKTQNPNPHGRKLLIYGQIIIVNEIFTIISTWNLVLFVPFGPQMASYNLQNPQKALLSLIVLINWSSLSMSLYFFSSARAKTFYKHCSHWESMLYQSAIQQGMLFLELSSYLMEISNGAYTTLRQFRLVVKHSVKSTASGLFDIRK